MSSDKVVRVGVLGTGRVVHTGLLLPARYTAGIEVHAVASRNAERGRTFADANGIARACSSYDELLADDSLDAVYIALPTALHGPWAHRAFEFGKDVLCEKPLGVNADVVGHTVRRAQEAGRVLQDGMHLRHSRLLHRAMEIVADGRLGVHRRVESFFVNPNVPMVPGDFRLHYELGGGATLDLGCYAVACLRQVLGEEPRVVKARCECIAPQIDGWMEATVAFPSGAVGRIECGFAGTHAGRVGLAIECERGSLTLDGTTGLHYTTADGEQVHEPHPNEWTYQLQLQEFVRRVRGAQPVDRLLEDAVGTARVIDGMYENAGLIRRGELSDIPDKIGYG